MQRFEPKKIESKWQKIWADTKLYEASEDSSKQKIYATPMLPYPSGAGLHVGHVRNYSIADVVARFNRQRGFNVMSNMGWDAFGLPAENYAIKTGTPPKETTEKNIANFKNQMQRLGLSYDWSREIKTSDPEYYKWTQWIFLQLFKKGLAYQKSSNQWWCNQCKTVLANEQVVNGCCWRHEDLPVERKNTKQWFFKITDYADELLNATDDLDWPQHIKTMQKNWIGRSVGAQIKFKFVDSELELEVFTTAHDTIYGTSFMVLAPEHPLVNKITTKEQNHEVHEYIKQASKKTELQRQQEEKNKTGVATGAYVVNPVNGKQIPVWVADYVLMGYGTGAVMAVPGEDERDFEFASKYDLEIIYTTKQQEFISYQDIKSKPEKFELANSGEFNGMDFKQARTKILDKIVKTNSGKAKIQYKLRDWLISRQRYWGAPIPIIHCASCVDGADSSQTITYKNHDTFNKIKSGNKQVFTRSMTDELGRISANDVIRFESGSEVIYAKVKQIKTFKSLQERFEDKKDS